MNKNNDDEQSLLAKFLAGDTEAINEFFRRYGGIIMCVVGKINTKGPVIDPQDLFNEIVVFILENKQKIISDFKFKCKFSSYFFLISRRYALKKVKEENRQPGSKDTVKSEELPASLLEEAVVWDDDVKKVLPIALEYLSENEKIFITMYYYHGRTVTEIMRMFKWSSPNSVYSKKNRIIKKLQKHIKKILKERGLNE